MAIIFLVIIKICLSVSFSPISFIKSDEAVLRLYGLPTNSEALIRYLDSLSGSVNKDDVLNLIHNLGSDDFQKREHALDQLVASGAVAIPELTLVVSSSPDPEIRVRGREAIARIKRIDNLPASASAVRLLRSRRSDEALGAILKLLPKADKATQVEAYLAVRDMASSARGINPLLLNALSDSSPVRRAAAAWAIGLDGSEKDKELVHAALKDRSDEVRLRAAQGLLVRRDRAAVPILISLLTSQQTIAWQAEELLRYTAGYTGSEQRAADTKEPAKRQAMWLEWWEKTRRGDWSPTHKRGPRLVFVGTGKPNESGARLHGSDGTVRFELAGVKNSSTLGWLPDEEKFVCSEGAGAETRIVRRDLGGRVTWRSPALDSDVWDICRAPGGELLLLLSRGTFLSIDTRGAARVVRPAARDGYRRTYQQFIFDRERLVYLSQYGWAPIPRVEWSNAAQNTIYQHLNFPPNQDRDFIRVWSMGNGLALIHSPISGRGPEMGTTHMTIFDCRARPVTSLISPVWPATPPSLLQDGSILVAGWALLGGFWDAHIVTEIDPLGRSIWELVDPTPVNWVQDAFPLLRLGFDSPRVCLDTWDERRRQLDSADESIRRYAAIRLHLTQPSNAELTAALAETAGSEENVRRALYALACKPDREIGEQTVPALIRHLGESGEPEFLLDRLGQPAMHALLKVFADHNNRPRQRASAARCLGRWIDNSEVKVTLQKALAESNREVRIAAVIGICQQDDKAVEWISVIEKLINDQDKVFAGRVLVALGSFQSASEKVIPILSAALRQSDLSLSALRGLDQIAKRAPLEISNDKKTTEILLNLTSAGENAPEIVCGSIALLATVYSHPKAALQSPDTFVQKLKSLLADHANEKITEFTLQAALEALMELGPRAAKARVEIRDIFKRKEHIVDTRIAALKALSAVAPTDAKQAAQLVAESESEDLGLRNYCRGFIAKLP